MRFLFISIVALCLLFPAFAGGVLEQCTLKNTDLCGRWNSYANPPRDLEVFGHRLEWEGGDYADCDTIGEDRRDGIPASVLECMVTTHDLDGTVMAYKKKFFLLRLHPSSVVNHGVLYERESKDLPEHFSAYNEPEYWKEKCPVVDIFDDECWNTGFATYAPAD